MRVHAEFVYAPTNDDLRVQNKVTDGHLRNVVAFLWYKFDRRALLPASFKGKPWTDRQRNEELICAKSSSSSTGIMRIIYLRDDL